MTRFFCQMKLAKMLASYTTTWPVSFTLQSAAKLNDLVVHHNKLMNGDRLENPICFPHPKQFFVACLVLIFELHPRNLR